MSESFPSFEFRRLAEPLLERIALESSGGERLSRALCGAWPGELKGRKLAVASPSMSGGVMSADMYSSSWLCALGVW